MSPRPGQTSFSNGRVPRRPSAAAPRRLVAPLPPRWPPPGALPGVHTRAKPHSSPPRCLPGRRRGPSPFSRMMGSFTGACCCGIIEGRGLGSRRAPRAHSSRPLRLIARCLRCRPPQAPRRAPPASLCLRFRLAKDCAFRVTLLTRALGHQRARTELRRQLQRYLLHAVRRNGRVARREHAKEKFEEAAGGDQFALQKNAAEKGLEEAVDDAGAEGNRLQIVSRCFLRPGKYLLPGACLHPGAQLGYVAVCQPTARCCQRGTGPRRRGCGTGSAKR